jgi:hypothetical protein
MARQTPPKWTSGRILTEIYGFDRKLCLFNKIQAQKSDAYQHHIHWL